MTNGELIDQLSELPRDWTVVIEDWDDANGISHLPVTVISARSSKVVLG